MLSLLKEYGRKKGLQIADQISDDEDLQDCLSDSGAHEGTVPI